MCVLCARSIMNRKATKGKKILSAKQKRKDRSTHLSAHTPLKTLTAQGVGTSNTKNRPRNPASPELMHRNGWLWPSNITISRLGAHGTVVYSRDCSSKKLSHAPQPQTCVRDLASRAQPEKLNSLKNPMHWMAGCNYLKAVPLKVLSCFHSDGSRSCSKIQETLIHPCFNHRAVCHIISPCSHRSRRGPCKNHRTRAT